MIGNLWMFNSMDLQFYMINEDLRGLKLLCWWADTDCYDVLHRHLMVSRDYELIVYKIIWVGKKKKILSKFWHEVYDVLKDSWNLVCEWLCDVDNGCDSIIVPRWESTFRFEISIISLGVTRICHEMVKWKEREP